MEKGHPKNKNCCNTVFFKENRLVFGVATPQTQLDIDKGETEAEEKISSEKINALARKLQENEGLSKEFAEEIAKLKLKAESVRKKLTKAYRVRDELLLKNEKIYIEARTDHLTDIPNKRFYEETITREIGRAHRGQNLSVIMIDIDFFKDYNDKHGHSTGDQVLKDVASIIKNNLFRKDLDVVARYGGEEFIVILPDVDIEGAKKVAERLCEAVEKETREKKYPTLTISLGYAGFDKNEEQLNNAEGLQKAADAALYHAKNEGRNRTTAFEIGMEMPSEEEKIKKRLIGLQMELERIKKELRVRERTYNRLQGIQPKNENEKKDLQEELDIVKGDLESLEIRTDNATSEIQQKEDALIKLKKVA